MSRVARTCAQESVISERHARELCVQMRKSVPVHGLGGEALCWPRMTMMAISRLDMLIEA